jgi:hypothetical protein
MTFDKFLTVEKSSGETLKLKLLYIDIAEDLIAGILLSQIIYWNLPGKSGRTKIRINKEGRDWIAKQRHDWYKECRISPSQYDRAIKILKNLNIVDTKIFKFKGNPTIHVSLNKDSFLDLVEKYLIEQNNKKLEEEINEDE